MSKLDTFVQSLLEKLRNKLDKYNKRINTANKPVSAGGAVQTIAATVGAGAAIGTIIPGPGTLVGTAAGAAIGTSILIGQKIQEVRLTNKKDNANTVINYLKLTGNPDDALNKIANKVIKDREKLLTYIKETDDNKKLLANYLAANIFASIKSQPKEKALSLDDMIDTGLKSPKSGKFKIQLFANTSLELEEKSNRQEITPKSFAANINK